MSLSYGNMKTVINVRLTTSFYFVINLINNMNTNQDVTKGW